MTEKLLVQDDVKAIVVSLRLYWLIKAIIFDTSALFFRRTFTLGILICIRRISTWSFNVSNFEFLRARHVLGVHGGGTTPFLAPRDQRRGLITSSYAENAGRSLIFRWRPVTFHGVGFQGTSITDRYALADTNAIEYYRIFALLSGKTVSDASGDPIQNIRSNRSRNTGERDALSTNRCLYDYRIGLMWRILFGNLKRFRFN